MTIRSANFASAYELTEFLASKYLGREDILSLHTNSSGRYDVVYDDDDPTGFSSGTVDGDTGAATLDVDATSATITRALGSFLADGIRAGDYVTTSGFTDPSNNGTFLVLDASDTDLTLDTEALVTESGTGNEQVVSVGHSLSVGEGCRLHRIRVTAIGADVSAVLFGVGDPFTISDGDTFDVDWAGRYAGDGSLDAENSLVFTGVGLSYFFSWLDRKNQVHGTPSP